MNTYAEARLWARKRASELLKECPETALHGLVSKLSAELREEFPAVAREHWTYGHSVAEDALKGRVLIGRCRSHGGKGVAYYWPRAEGRLSDTRCPLCGYRLAQTSLALQVPFLRLPRR